MINIKNFSLPLATVLCTSLLFSCTTNIEFPPPAFCQKKNSFSCLPATSLEDCESSGGEPKSSCELTCEIPEEATFYKDLYSNDRPTVKCNGVPVNNPSDFNDRYNPNVNWIPSQLYFQNPGNYTIKVTVEKCNNQTVVCGSEPVTVLP